MPVSRIRAKVRDARRKEAQIAASRRVDPDFIALFNWYRERERQCGRHPKYRNSKSKGRLRRAQRGSESLAMISAAWESNVRVWEKKNPKPIYGRV